MRFVDGCLLAVAVSCGSGARGGDTTAGTSLAGGAGGDVVDAGAGGTEADSVAAGAGSEGGAANEAGAETEGGAAGGDAADEAGAGGGADEPWVGERVTLPIGPWGDSITAGRGSSTGNGWRRYLDDAARVAGYPVQWFGISASGDFPNPRHTGISNASIARCSQAVGDYLAPGKRYHQLPGMVMLLIGSVEMLNQVPGDVAAASYGKLLEQMGAAVPALQALVVSTLPPMQGDPANIDVYNRELQKPGGYWDTFASAHPSVLLVRVDVNAAMGGKFRQDLFVDTHHPSDAGYAIMGRAYWDALFPAVDALTRN